MNTYENVYTEDELKMMKYQMEQDPLIPRKTKVMRIEYNIRPEQENSFDTVCKTKVIECRDGSCEDEMLMFNGITLPECCLMQYDHLGKSHTDENIYYDLAIVRTNKSKEYWALHFK